MVDLEWTTARRHGVTLVAVRIDNRVAAPGVPAHRVRLEPRVDGAVWPPRTEGVPAAPWSTDGGTERSRAPDDGDDPDTAVVVVPTGTVGSLGFASDGPPEDPPVAVADVQPAEAVESDPGAADVLRVLGDPAPPRDVVDPEPIRQRAMGPGDGGGNR